MLDKRQIAPLLLQTDFFRGLPESAIEACVAAAQVCRFDAGEMLFARGEAGSRLFILASGEVRLSLVSEDGRELSVRIAGAGEILGEISALDGGSRSADAVALKPVSALALTRAELLRLMSAIPELLQRIVVLLCTRLRSTTDQLEAIALHSVEERLARLILADIASAGGDTSRSRVMNLTQGELAQLIGASRPKVNARSPRSRARGASAAGPASSRSAFRSCAGWRAFRMSDARQRPAMAGLLAVAAVLLALALTPERFRTGQRESLFDLSLSLTSRAAADSGPTIVIADIDRESLAAVGPWPWPRGRIATMIETAFARGASSVAVDILFAGADQRSPGSVARRLAEETGDQAIAEAARRLEDGDDD